MLRKRIILLSALLAIAAITASGFVWCRSLPTPSLRLEVEQAVYEVLIAKNGHLIGEYTLAGYDCTSKTCVQSLLEDFPQLKRRTISDFQEHDKQSYPLRDYLPQQMRSGFLDPTQNREKGMQISFSRIAFDPFLTQALVLVEDCRGDACFDSAGEFMYSTGRFIFLQKREGKWYIQSESESYLKEKPSP